MSVPVRKNTTGCFLLVAMFCRAEMRLIKQEMYSKRKLKKTCSFHLQASTKLRETIPLNNLSLFFI